MKDQEFLMWLHERLEHVHREPAQADYMHKLRAIIEATPEDKETPNFGFTQTMDDLRTLGDEGAERGAKGPAACGRSRLSAQLGLASEAKGLGMTNSRVTPQGQAMGKSAARLAELGRARLVEMGLDAVKGTRLRDEMCKTCACRLNTVPNGCLQTQMDFLKAAAEGKPFLCHAPMDGRICAGWAGLRAELVANPLPPQAMALIAKWDYSPPDDESPNK